MTTVADLVGTLDKATLVGPIEAALAATVHLTDATHDSRQAAEGMLFCALVGALADGHDFAAEAVGQGASALLVERPVDVRVPQIQVPDARVAMGPAAALVHGSPTRALTVVGITGTNGKTTTTYLLEHAFAQAGWGTGVIGTIEARVNGQAVTGVRTTPEGTDLQRLLHTMQDQGVRGVAMEASSHGLAMHRVDGIEFDVAVHLNLTQDHLDFHADMEDYFLAKARLFTLADRGIVCIEDAWGRRMAQESAIPVQTFGRPALCGTVEPDFALVDVVTDPDRTSFILRSLQGDVELSTALLGDVNAVNAAAAWLAAVAVGIDPQVAATGVAECRGVPGRLEAVANARGFTVLVDYAHTPDAIEHVVQIARGIAGGHRVVMVVGCGGDRDRAKRGPMGAAAAQADLAVFTADNPRSEDPEDILDAMVAGVLDAHGEVVREVDRRRAIEFAIAWALPGDVVVIAGKGHETGQTFAERTVPFDDRLVAADALGTSDGTDLSGASA